MRHAVGVTCVFCFGLAFGCTDTELFVNIDRDSALLRHNIVAEICAPVPEIDQVPYKVLFVVDTSGSNNQTDPRPTGGFPRRELAVRNAIASTIGNPVVSFGVITFSDEPRRQTFGFVRDIDILNGAAANIGTAQGGTNYSDTLWTMIDFILNDVETLSPAEAARTHYLVYWLSDGAPTVGVTEPASLLPGVEYLHETLQNRVAEISVNTAFLASPASVDPALAADLAIAQRLLEDMAEQGAGDYIDIPSGESFNFEIDPVPVVQSFVLAEVLANNMYAQFGEFNPRRDSDGDGLPDDVEEDFGTDPALMDTDGDGLRDGLEAQNSDRVNPLLDDGTCTRTREDPDGDGLYTCEENLIGTNPNLPDSDDDFLLDRVEWTLRGIPVIKDDFLDLDDDGFDNRLEILAHMVPDEFNSAAQYDEWGYRYQTSLNGNGTSDRPCYDVRVDNIGVYETRETPEHERGVNVIELFATFRPAESTNQGVVYRAVAESRVLLPDQRFPANDTFTLESDDFTPIVP